MAERGADSLANVQQFLRDQTRDPVIAAHDRVFQAFGERYCDLVAQWGHKMNPIRTQPRGQDWNRYDPAAWKPEFFRHQANDVAVAQRFRPADVKNPTRGFRDCQHAD